MRPSKPTDAQLSTLPVQERLSPQARNVRIEVHSDGTVRLVIPRGASKRSAYEFLRSREDWVRRKLAELQVRRECKRTRPPLRWDDSDTIPLHGVETPLRVVPARVKRPSVRFEDQGISLYCALARTPVAACAQAVRAALRERARREARRMLDEEATRLDLDYRGPRIADQASLWGSCTHEGVVSLNWRLILAPPAAFRYVVIHELCHRRHLDHSQRFWQLVARQMPDYETWRRWLREHGASLHEVLPRPRRGSAPDPAVDAACAGPSLPPHPGD
jgi:predicted metal-dependent hydrolase